MTTLAKLLGMGGGGTPELWTPTRIVQQREYVTSPTDDEIYQRKTAAGASATDPADDITNYRAASFERATQIGSVYTGGAWSAGGQAPGTAMATASTFPSVSAGVRTNVLNVTGRGYVNELLILRSTSSATDPAFLLEVILDGRTVFSANMAGNTLGTQYWALLVGKYLGVGVQPFYEDIRFNRSIQMFITPVTALAASRYTLYSAVRGIES